MISAFRKMLQRLKWLKLREKGMFGELSALKGTPGHPIALPPL
jgi:hypothetical protein